MSRVTDTTWLDRIGIPVYASIRPDGLNGSICVHNGKGFTHEEAKIGAYMEAIEFSFAQYGRNRVGYEMATPAQIVDTYGGGIRFTEFAPRLGQRVDPTDKIAAVWAEDLMSGLGKVLVPAELVYHPFYENPGKRLYGTTTNGLASGNTLQEATVHGLAEVMERHVRSFDHVRDRSVPVEMEGIPQKVNEMRDRIEGAGLQCHLRYSANDFGMAFFTAYVLEPDEHAPLSVSAGLGFHPIREIAAVRAIAEAVQGRLTFIHGGRDDLIKRFALGERLGRELELEYTRQLRRKAASRDGAIAYRDVPDHEPTVDSIDSALGCLFLALRQAGLHHVARVVFTEGDYPFQIVKVVVPGAEFYELELRRVGPRVLGYFKALG